VEAVASINARIFEIQSRMAQLSTAPALPAAVTGAAGLTSTTSAVGATTGADFSAALDSAVAASGSTTGAAEVGSGRNLVNADGVPLELVPYGNGQVPADALSPIGSAGHRLWKPAATSFEAMRAAAARDGVTIGITDSYRSYDSQVELAARKGLYSQGGLAAKPGTSDHGWGIATDLKLDPAALSWMRRNAGTYGFVEDTPRESWHWGYHPTH
jgi:hypothetical protein